MGQQRLERVARPVLAVECEAPPRSNAKHGIEVVMREVTDSAGDLVLLIEGAHIDPDAMSRLRTIRSGLRRHDSGRRALTLWGHFLL